MQKNYFFFKAPFYDIQNGIDYASIFCHCYLFNLMGKTSLLNQGRLMISLCIYFKAASFILNTF